MLLKLNNITFGYQDEPAVKNINLQINSGDFIGMIGPNGGGKSTIIKLIMGLISPWSGSIEKGKDEAGDDIQIGYLPQYHDFDKSFPISVEEVVLSGYATKGRIKRKEKKQALLRINELMDELGAEIDLKRSIGELSGGQMQRVFLARALITRPKLLILDEPVTYVDNRFENEMYDFLARINAQTAILLVSHDVGQIVSLVNTIACVNTHLHYHPSNRITQDVLDSYNCPIDLITHGQVPHRVLHQH